jgi:hypothetical protein
MKTGPGAEATGFLAEPICTQIVGVAHREIPKKSDWPAIFSMSVVFERKSLAASMLRNGDNCPRAKKPGENGGTGRESASPSAISAQIICVVAN